MARVGGDIEAYCGRCKMMILHTIEAMVGATPARVHCNSCHSQHAYKAHPPGEGPAAPRRAKGESTRGGGRARGSDYDRLMEGRSRDDARRYSPKSTYQRGDVILHPTFGTGIATTVKDATKIEVLFPDGPRVLVHAR